MNSENKNLRTEIGETMFAVVNRVKKGTARPEEIKAFGDIASVLYTFNNKDFDFTPFTDDSEPKTTDEAAKSAVQKWMPMHEWDKCAFPVDRKMLHGRACYGGLDISSTGDITSFVLVFPPIDGDDMYYVLPFFWISEDNLEFRIKHDHVPYDLWKQQGYLQTTVGNVNYDFTEKIIEKLGTEFNIREIAFDRWGAEQIVQNLDGMGFKMVRLGQGFKDMTAPTKELMRLTLSQKIAHGGNSALWWMVNNIHVKTGPAGKIKPDKEKSTEKIDGAVAMIMAFARTTLHGGSAERTCTKHDIVMENFTQIKNEATEKPHIKIKVQMDTSELDETKEKLVRLVELIKEAQSLINDMATQSDDSTTLLDLNNIKVQEG